MAMSLDLCPLTLKDVIRMFSGMITNLGWPVGYFSSGPSKLFLVLTLPSKPIKLVVGG